MNEQLLEAYAATHYKFHWQGAEYVLKIGEESASLRALFNAYGCASAAYITPQNPESRQLSKAENAGLLTEFKNLLTEQGYDYLEGVGQDAKGKWPGEESLLILNISRSHASAFAQKYVQNAYVYCPSNCTPELVIAL